MDKLYSRSNVFATVCNTQALNTDGFKDFFCEDGNTYSVFLTWGISIPAITIILLSSLFADQDTCNTAARLHYK